MDVYETIRIVVFVKCEVYKQTSFLASSPFFFLQ